MIARGNPVGIRATGQVPDVVGDQVKDLHERIRSAEEDRRRWLDKQRILVEQRRGIRQKKKIPWVGANNDSWPLTDGVIRRWKAGIVSLILEADPVAWFFATKPEDIEVANSAQAFYHWKFTNLPRARHTVMELSDLVAQHGLAYSRQGWEYRVERSCRVVPVNNVFPGGPEAALEQVNQEITAQNQQLEQAQQAGQADPEATQAPLFTLPDFVQRTLQLQYDLDEEDPGQQGGMLEEAVTQIIQGAEYVKLFYHHTAADRPKWAALSPLDVVVPIKTGPISFTDFIAVNHRMTRHDLRAHVRDGLFDQESAEFVISKMQEKQSQAFELEASPFDQRGVDRTGLKRALDALEGVGPTEAGEEPALRNIWEIYCKLDLDGDNILERCVVWYDPESQTVLSQIEYPYPFEEWPIVQFEFEHTSDRPYGARGAAELLSTFQKQTNKLHNARLDAIQVLLSPMFKMRSVNGELQRNVRFRPGTFIPLQDVNDLQPLVSDFRPLSQFLQEEQFTKGLAEQFIGVFDASLTDPLAPSSRRTATEVSAVTAQISSVFGQDAALFQSSMTDVHKQLWRLWLEFGPDEEYFRATGEDKPRKIRKQDINRDFDIYPAGTPANTNKALAIAQARERIALLGPDQSGLINKRELFKSFLDITDRNLAKRIVRTEQEAAVVQLMLRNAAELGANVQGAAF